MNIKASEFLKEKKVKVCYVYQVELDDDDNLAYVGYRRYSDADEKIVEKSWDVQSFAKKIFNGEWIAYAGKLTKDDEGVEKLTNVSLVTVLTIEGNLYLTTASDDSKSNNLKSLPKFKHYE